MGCSQSSNCPVSESPDVGHRHLEQGKAGSSDQLNDAWDIPDVPISPVDYRPALGDQGQRRAGTWRMPGANCDPDRSESLDRPSRLSASQGCGSGFEYPRKRVHLRSCPGTDSHCCRRRFRFRRGSWVHPRRSPAGGIGDFGTIGTACPARCGSPSRSRLGTGSAFRHPPEHALEQSVLHVVHDGCIWSWEEEILLACIPPPHEVWRFPILMANLQDFTVTIMLAHVMPLDDNPVPDFRLHLGSIHCVEDSWS